MHPLGLPPMLRKATLYVAVVGVLGAVASGCGPTARTRASAAAGHIHGTFTLTAGPVPTCIGGSPCPTAFAQAEQQAPITVSRTDGTVIARTTTNASGEFAVDVPPGTYVVAAPEQNEPGLYSAAVTVNPTETVAVRLEVSEP